jgi:hypothetical protein
MPAPMADVNNVISMLNIIKQTERAQVIREVEAFAGDYHHHIDGRDVVIVEQLLDFLKTKEPANEQGN